MGVVNSLSTFPNFAIYFVSAVVLTNPLVRVAMQPLFDALQRQTPLVVLNGSIYLYDAP